MLVAARAGTARAGTAPAATTEHITNATRAVRCRTNDSSSAPEAPRSAPHRPRTVAWMAASVNHFRHAVTRSRRCSGARRESVREEDLDGLGEPFELPGPVRDSRVADALRNPAV